jgi:hypothetical protein
LFLFATPLGVGQSRRGSSRLELELFDRHETLRVLQLRHTIFLGGKRPKEIGAANLLLVDQPVVNQCLIDICDAVVVKKRAGEGLE